MVERSPEKAGVGGSSPSLATIIFNGLADQPEISHLCFCQFTRNSGFYSALLDNFRVADEHAKWPADFMGL